MRCTQCGEELTTVKRVVESGKTQEKNLVVAGFASKKTGKQSCRKGGPHRRTQPQHMSSQEIWTALAEQEGKSRGV